MDLKLVDYLLLAAETGSFAKAASKIGMAQPTFGRLIARLEKDCGARLLYRHGRGVALTKEGERFVEGIRPVLSQVEILRGSLQRERSPRGNVTVGMTPTKAEMFGLATVMAVRQQYPDIRLNVVCGFSGYVHEWLIDGSLDIALLNNARRSRQVNVDGLAKAGLYLVSKAGLSPIGKKEPYADLVRLADVPLVLPTRKNGLRVTLEEACAEHGVHLNLAFEMDTLSVLKELVLAGHAHTVVPLPAVQKEISTGLLQAFPLRPRLESVTVVATAFKRPQTHAIRAVKKVIAEVMKNAVDTAFPSVDVQM